MLAKAYANATSQKLPTVEELTAFAHQLKNELVHLGYADLSDTLYKADPNYANTYPTSMRKLPELPSAQNFFIFGNGSYKDSAIFEIALLGNVKYNPCYEGYTGNYGYISIETPPQDGFFSEDLGHPLKLLSVSNLHVEGYIGSHMAAIASHIRYFGDNLKIGRVPKEPRFEEIKPYLWSDRETYLSKVTDIVGEISSKDVVAKLSQEIQDAYDGNPVTIQHWRFLQAKQQYPKKTL